MQLSIFDALALFEPPAQPAPAEVWDWGDRPIRLLSMYQPWASLAADLIKLWETRPGGITWRNYRGAVAIHASKIIDWEAIAEIRGQVGDLGIDWDHLPTSSIIAIAEMTQCLCMTPELIERQLPLELALGRWEPNRRAIRLERVVKLPTPLSGVRGLQGLTHINPELQLKIKVALGLVKKRKRKKLGG